MFFKKFLFFLLEFFCCALIEEDIFYTSFELSKNYILDDYEYFKIALPKSMSEVCDYCFNKKNYQFVPEQYIDTCAMYNNVVFALYDTYIVLTDFCREKGYCWNDKILWESIVTYSHSGISNYPSEVTLSIKQEDGSYRLISFSYIILDNIFNVFEKKHKNFNKNKKLDFSRDYISEYIIGNNSSSCCGYTISSDLLNFISFFQNNEAKNIFIDIGLSFYDVVLHDIRILYLRKQKSDNCCSCITKIFHKKLTHYSI